MTVVVGVVGTSNSGKTSLAEALAGRLVVEGVRVGYLKHAHYGFTVDKEGSDSARLTAAGADPVAVAGPEGRFLLTRGDAPEAALGWLDGCDVVLVEGLGQGPWPKLRVARAGAEPREVAPPVVAEIETGSDGRPGSEAVDRALAAVRELLAVATGHEFEVSVTSDGVPVEVQGFTVAAVAGTVLGMLGTLRGVEDPTAVTVTVRRRRPPPGFGHPPVA